MRVSDKKLTLLTGTSGSGKTTFLLKELSAASSFVGVITPGVYEDGEKVGVEAWLLSGAPEPKERFILARRRDLAIDIPADDTGLGWVFDPEAIKRVNDHLRSNLTSEDLSPVSKENDSRLVIDEIGPLELTSNKGFTAALELLDEALYPNVMVVIRPSLLDIARSRWQDIYDTIEILEV